MSSAGRFLRVYHERQVAGLCGVHCLNTLLQGSTFTEVDLAEIAARLDEQEKQAMAAMGTDTVAYQAFLEECSGNVSEEGNYSVQVLQEALKIVHLQCFSLLSEESRVFRTATPAYICNLLNHWFTIRQVGGVWLNFNSLLERPQRLSDSYLELFMQTLQSQGYSIFVVYPETGHQWPSPPADRSRGDMHNIDLSLPPQNEPAIPSEKEQLEMAMAESLSAADHHGHSVPQDDSDDALSRVLYLSLMESQQQSSSSSSSPPPPSTTIPSPQPPLPPPTSHQQPAAQTINAPRNAADDDDPELLEALRQSLDASPPSAAPTPAPAPEPPLVNLVADDLENDGENDPELMEALRLSSESSSSSSSSNNNNNNNNSSSSSALKPSAPPEVVDLEDDATEDSALMQEALQLSMSGSKEPAQPAPPQPTPVAPEVINLMEDNENENDVTDDSELMAALQLSMAPNEADASAEHDSDLEAALLLSIGS